MRTTKLMPKLGAVVLILLMGSWAGAPLVSAWEGTHAVVKVWDTAVPLPPSLTLGMTPGESVEDVDGLTQHGTGFPTIATVYARSSHPGGLSGLSFWNPDSNVFVWYGKTMSGVYTLTEPTVSSGFPGSVDINRGGGPVLPNGPYGTSFGAGDVWVGGQQNEPVYVLMAGTAPLTGLGRFRSYGCGVSITCPAGPPSGQAFGLEVDEATGNVFVAQPWERKIARLNPSTAVVTSWDIGTSCPGTNGCGNPVYVTVDGAGNPYHTAFNSGLGDAIVRVNRGPDGVLGNHPVTGTSDDSISLWPIPTQPAFRRPPLFLTDPEENPNGLITVDSTGKVWFAETDGPLSSPSHKIGRLNPATNEICEYTTIGLRNPQQITATGSGGALQVFFTEGEGNSVSVLTESQADQAIFPNRICTTVVRYTFFPARVLDVTTLTYDEQVLPLQTAIVPTIHHVGPVGGSGITRFSPMPNPILSAEGTPIGDAGNGFPSGLSGVYAANRIAGAYLTGNKHFELEAKIITATPAVPEGGLPGRMTGGGRVYVDGDDMKVTYGFVLRCSPDEKRKDALQVNWSGDNRFHLKRMTAASCTDDPTITPDPPSAAFDTHSGRGTGRYNGQDGATAEWTFTDAGEPGTNDTVRLVIRDANGTIVLDVTSQLKKGNHQAHNARVSWRDDD